MSTTPARQRDGSVARVGSDHTLPSRAARKPILPRASLRAQDPSRGAQTDHTQLRVPSLDVHVDNPRAAAGWVRSPRWKRSISPLARSAKADPPPSFLSGAGPIPRSLCQPTTQSSESLPSVSMSTTPARQRDGSVARVGSDQHNICRTARKPILPRASCRAQDPSPTKSTPAERDGSVARVGSDHPLPSCTARKLSLPRASLRAQDPSRGAQTDHTQQRAPPSPPTPTAP